MLDTETKRRIDTARDILVGKIPDPKSQVEQITIALIYKFMDDMDKEAEELGGERQFFVDDYADYRWENLIGLGIGGQQALELYEAGIRAMPENEHLPKLFRDIFKNAYLPYRDPETLRGFLKVINEFEYDHSERLGDAFEYLLSVLGSQGDAGQFRTPRHIIDFMVRVIDPKKGETVLDPACGTAGFLIAAYKHILAANSHNGRSTLSIDERKALVKAVQGYDISPDMVRLSLVNLYLHGFSRPLIDEYDTLTSDVKWNEFADVILANPPFMSPKGGIKPHKRFSVQSKRSEVLFVDYIAEHLHSNGRAGVIVPEGIIFQSQKAYKQLRQLLVSDYLYAVVSLPAGVFQPYSGVKTSILLMDKGLSKRSDSILFVKVEQDGFDLGAQRRAIAEDDLPMAEQVLQGFREACLAGEAFDTADYDNAWVVEKSKIGEDGEWNLSGERYREVEAIHAGDYEWVELGEVCFKVASSINPNEHSGAINYIGLENIEQHTGSLTGNFIADFSSIKSMKTIFQQNDVLYGKLRPNLNKVYLASMEGICSTDILVYRTNDDMIPLYLSYIMRSISFNKIVLKGLGGAQLPRTNTKYLEKIKIPLPPLEVQKTIVEEIEGYQKIIDGARAVVENYKPQIQIDPDWKHSCFKNAPLEIIDGDRGVNYPKKEDFKSDGYCVFLSTKNVRKNGFTFNELQFVTKQKDDSLRKGKLKRGDVLLTTRGTVGNTAIYNDLVKFENIRINSGMLIFRPNPVKISGTFLFYFFQSQNFINQKDAIISGSAQPQLPIRSLNNITLPIPPLETQTQIVAQIEKEQALVDANKELITLFEQKIKDTIERVWQT